MLKVFFFYAGCKGHNVSLKTREIEEQKTVKLEHKSVLILDYSVDRKETQVIRKGLSDKGVKVSSFFIDTAASFPNDMIQQDFTHIIHTGSALSINEEAPFTAKAVDYIRAAQAKGLWQMGICYGHQLVCKALVGDQAVRSSPNGFEVGWGKVFFSEVGKELLGVGEEEKVWQHHFDEVTELLQGSQLLASNAHSEVQAYVNFEAQILGAQFHPEFNRTDGNDYFLQDRKFISKNNIDVDALVLEGPTFDTVNVFFDFFLEQEVKKLVAK
ncbi:type 1 glutamine amidotransferase [Spongiimicrobium salis]|uniref:type 1 glutamine amidotransferase n=1 Tax=Spongiimicrobium salis TaxID=1667022 RepID=UPI00374DA426